jgi:ABC-type Fe3+-siderophore transport system permease subunit
MQAVTRNPLADPGLLGVETVITAGIVRDVFGLDCVVIADPVSHTPLVVPIGVGHRAGDRPTVAS